MTARKWVSRPLARLIGLSLASLMVPAPLAAQERPAMSAEDLVTMPRLGGPAVDADGRIAIYPVTTTDPDSFKRSTALYLRPLDTQGTPAVELTALKGASDAAFGGDGWLYYLADDATPAAGKDATSQVWRARVDPDGSVSGIKQVTDFARGVNGYTVARDGGHIAVWAELPRSCIRLDCDDSAKAYLPGPGDGRLFDGSGGFVRHWDGWETPGTHSRVFAFALQDGTAQGPGVALDGPAGDGAPTGDTPTQPFGGGEDIAWAPDGKSVYFTAREAGADEPYSTNLDIWWSDLTGSAPTNLTAANEALDALPTPSPDGQFLAYVAMARPTYEADRQVVMLRDLRSGKTTALTQDWDRSVGSLAWTPDSRWLIATAQDVLDTPAFRIDPRSGAVERLDLMAGNEAHIGNVTPLHSERLLFTRDSVGGPAELYLSEGWQQAEPLTDIAVSRMGKLASVMTTRFSFAGANGDTVWGQIHKPEAHTGKLPAILYVHGGPQGSFNDGWSTRWNPRVLASQGYAVISVDFHGSTGYGQAFTDAINRDWGGKPLEDLQKGLAAALAQDSSIDGDRACAMGASYGGYMMNWIAGKWPDRFRCLIQHDGLFDMRSFYFTTEELWFPRWDFGGGYAEAAAEYEKWNPVNHIDAWKTPMLVVTGEKDFRVPYTQGLASFTVLQEKRIPSQLLVFPGENHWVLSPKNSLQWHQTVFSWLDRWLKPAE
ncbi:alpha/beta hydrolase family protein [Qipengyuania marisflavi]|uniref:S9 family peptidase n=1 Tax=Qipengyuania marisflavi TaxID=2486356 RepID=A0A5S3P5A3_9SPHN|nr:S9 family peptidase [Qipengyuania marisflavi]TMM48219.1 S9 family peptidase [Qipengyuania marisflavi]